MATALLYIGWNRPVAGKETEAWKYFMEEGDAALTKFQKQGYFERVERVALTPHGGSVNGFLLLFGERVAGCHRRFRKLLEELLDRPVGIEADLERVGTNEGAAVNSAWEP